MKQKGKWLIGIDFGAGDQMRVLAIPVEGGRVRIEKAESLDRDKFDDFMADAARAEDERRAKAKPRP